ncbi:hypothetical protein F5883DRAFT_67058 [Diaporthe sp. PMI_573]|nr:hypothetical protein F5883DRAFT_67058 [Diaporthaceae sp. PMI_573]
MDQTAHSQSFHSFFFGSLLAFILSSSKSSSLQPPKETLHCIAALTFHNRHSSRPLWNLVIESLKHCGPCSQHHLCSQHHGEPALQCARHWSRPQGETLGRMEGQVH